MASILKVDTIQDQAGNNIISEAANVITIGASGDTITVPAGATVSGFTSAGIDDNATSTAITIDSSERIGIGTTAPSNYYSNKLVIDCGSASQDGLTIVSESTKDGMVSFADGTSGSNRYSGFILYDHADNEFRIATNGSERMRIDSSGNVGIKNTTMASFSNLPATDLVVGAGTTNSGITIYSGTTHGSNIAFADGASGDARNQGIIQYHHNGDYMRFFTSATERMRINSTGLGIGTSSPANNLHIFTDASGEGILVKSTGNTYNDIIGDANRSSAGNNLVRFRGNWNGNSVAMITFDAGSDTTNKDNADIVFHTASSGTLFQRMKISESGNVGIGETAPLGKLHIKTADSGATVNGVADELVLEGSGRSGMTILSGTSSIGTIGFGDSGNNIIGSINYNHDGNLLTFFTNDAERMRIDSSGSVGIGTSTPQTIFHILQTAETVDSGIKIVGSSSPVSGRIYMNSTDIHIDNATAGQNTGITLDTSGKTGIGTASPSTTLDVNGTIKATGFDGANAPAWSAKRGSPQTGIADNTSVLIICDSEDFDTDNAYNTSTGIFTVPSGKGGKYMVGAVFRTHGTGASTRIATSIFIGSNVTRQTNFNQVSSGESSGACHAVLNLSAGDEVSFKIFQNSGSAVNAEASGKTYFYGYKIG